MQPASGTDIDTDMARQTRGAARFFWMWLIVATATSVTGNVAHAVLQAESRTVALAAGAALVPPLVLLAATHSIAVLVRTRAGGLTYWCALLMTLALATCAFVLSFDALRSLAVTLGRNRPGDSMSTVAESAHRTACRRDRCRRRCGYRRENRAPICHAAPGDGRRQAIPFPGSGIRSGRRPGHLGDRAMGADCGIPCARRYHVEASTPGGDHPRPPGGRCSAEHDRPHLQGAPQYRRPDPQRGRAAQRRRMRAGVGVAPAPKCLLNWRVSAPELSPTIKTAESTPENQNPSPRIRG
jgi:hypothetical protein